MTSKALGMTAFALGITIFVCSLVITMRIGLAGADGWLALGGATIGTGLASLGAYIAFDFELPALPDSRLREGSDRDNSQAL
ncbi:hypothetical protein [Ralstonia pickettii]|uniref:hypothetical protein n=2 Tax=Ralstonia TaxID=48736 RepID=UPI00087625B9|nr:hypothetical protein [Ralstonia pickettii]SCW98309.1 hypothetical protein SAMN02799637_04743 [Ralstonia sp. UNCCL144]